MKHALEITDCATPVVKIGGRFYLTATIKKYLLACAGLDLEVWEADGVLLIAHANGGARFTPIGVEEYTFLGPKPKLFADIQECMTQLRIISGNPVDVKLLKKELKENFEADVIRQSRKNLKTLGEL